jgi:hypothetical protein
VTSQPIAEFKKAMPLLEVSEKCELVHSRMVEVLEEKYPGKFLAVLFKSPAMSKDVFERATSAPNRNTE